MRTHLSYANLMATAAVFIALGGVSYAAIKLPANSVGTKQLMAKAVTSPKVKDGSLQAKDFKAGELPRGETGPQGAPGRDGANGAPGRDGANGAPGSSRGYAYIKADGAFDPERSKGVVTSKKATDMPGWYCVKFAFPVVNVVASPIFGYYQVGATVIKGADSSCGVPAGGDPTMVIATVYNSSGSSLNQDVQLLVN